MAYYFRLPQITDLTIGQQSALNETEAIAISGGPGTGKSVVSLWRHIRNHGIGEKKSLLLTYSKTLTKYLANTATAENEEAGLNVERTFKWLTHYAKNFDEIIIDEAQDIDAESYSKLKKYSTSICYGADDQQIIYPEKSTNQKELCDLFPDNEEYPLDENFRNSYEIMLFIKALFFKRLIPQGIINNLLQQGRQGNKPAILISPNPEKRLKAIADIIQALRSDAHNIGILVPLKGTVKHYYQQLTEAGITCSQYESSDSHLEEIENVHITTFKSCKGIEFDTVIIPEFHNMYHNVRTLRVVEENDYYVALTRAKRNLYLLSAITPSFVERSEEQKKTYTKEKIK